jgi:hypothetical protein
VCVVSQTPTQITLDFAFALLSPAPAPVPTVVGNITVPAIDPVAARNISLEV